eukprot:260615-Prymnesium_polylepis.1
MIVCVASCTAVANGIRVGLPPHERFPIPGVATWPCSPRSGEGLAREAGRRTPTRGGYRGALLTASCFCGNHFTPSYDFPTQYFDP